VAFALKVDEGDEHEQAANKKSHLSVPSRRASTKHSPVESRQRKGRRSNDVRFWHLADISQPTRQVCFGPKSGRA